MENWNLRLYDLFITFHISETSVKVVKGRIIHYSHVSYTSNQPMFFKKLVIFRSSEIYPRDEIRCWERKSLINKAPLKSPRIKATSEIVSDVVGWKIKSGRISRYWIIHNTSVIQKIIDLIAISVLADRCFVAIFMI